MSQCYGCYRPLIDLSHEGHYHHTCSKKLFGTERPPTIDFGNDEIEELAKKSIGQHLGLTGVQPKISLHIEKKEKDPTHRLMIVDLWGNFILKPPTRQFPEMPMVEDATMHMAKVVGLVPASHGLIQLRSGELAYITKRFDRTQKGMKIAVEDFCQLSELLTESKYDTSTEKAGRIILKYSSQPGLDVVTFFDTNLFCFLTGNADMHLKNFSLVRNEAGEIVLSPAYDLLSTRLLMSEDHEEMALTVNGKKSKIKRHDFVVLAQNLQIPNKAIENSFARILKYIPALKAVVQNSFLSENLKRLYQSLIDERAMRLQKS